MPVDAEVRAKEFPRVNGRETRQPAEHLRTCKGGSGDGASNPRTSQRRGMSRGRMAHEVHEETHHEIDGGSDMQRDK